VAYTNTGVVVALVFVTLPFVVHIVEPLHHPPHRLDAAGARAPIADWHHRHAARGHRAPAKVQDRDGAEPLLV
jgi:hypothetical protein